MDAPLLIQPLVFPQEVQRQAHNIDIDERYPLDFYASSWNMEKTNLFDKIDLVKKRLGHRINSLIINSLIPRTILC